MDNLILRSSHLDTYSLCPAGYNIEVTIKLTSIVVAMYLQISQALNHNNIPETTFVGITA